MFFRIPQKYLRSFLVQSFVLALCRSVVSHPHMWIDLKTEIVFNKEAYRWYYQEWLFDDFYSVALLEDAAQHPDGVGKDYNRDFANPCRSAFMELFHPIMVGTNEVQEQVQQFETELHGNRVWLSFTTQLETPAFPTTEAFSYSIFDLTYTLKCIILMTPLSRYGAVRQKAAKVKFSRLIRHLRR